MATPAQTPVACNNPPNASDDRAVAPTFTHVRTDLDIHGLLSSSLSSAEEQDGAEGHPLVFDMSNLHESLDVTLSCSPSVASSCDALSLTSTIASTSAALSSSSPVVSRHHTLPFTSSVISSDGATSSTHPVPSHSRPSFTFDPRVTLPSLPPHTSRSPSSTTPHSTATRTVPHIPRTTDPAGALPSLPTHPSSPPSRVPHSTLTHTASSSTLPTKRPADAPLEGKPPKRRKQTEAQIARKKARSKLRSVKARRAIAAAVEDGRAPNFYKTPSLSTTLHVPQPQIVQTEINSRDLPVTRHCWTGKNLSPNPTVWTLDELLQKGFRVVRWDRGAPLVITDKDRRVIAVFVGPPLSAKGADWENVAKDAVKAMATARQAGLASDAFTNDMRKHRRGGFIALAVGVSHGNGRQRPGNLYHTRERLSLVKDLLSNPSIQRFAGYQSSIFSFFAPKIYRHYCQRLSHLFEHEPTLQRTFSNSVFPAVSFNLGPATVSLDHTDAANVGYGLCALTALGSFDPQKGGHLVLFDLGLLIEFSDGDVGLLPSGILRHGNTAIQEGEERYSIAQYCAGGLLQYADYGYQTAASAMRGKSKTKAKEIKKALDGSHEGRVQAALDMFSIVDELDGDRKLVFNGFASYVKSDGAPS